MEIKVRHIIFFKSGTNLAVFASNVVDVFASKAFGLSITLEELVMNTSVILGDGVKRHFWIVTKYPEELIARLDDENHAVRGTSGYRVAQPRDIKALNFLRQAEDKAYTTLFFDQTALAN